MRGGTGTTWLTRAVPIDSSDAWELSASSGSVRLAPLSETVCDPEVAATTTMCVKLEDLGVLDSAGCDGILLQQPFYDDRSEVVVMLPHTLRPHVANMWARARSSPFSTEPWSARDTWIFTWHRFIDTEEGLPADLFDQLASNSRGCGTSKGSTRSRRYLFASELEVFPRGSSADPFAVDAASSSVAIDSRHPAVWEPSRVLPKMS